MDKESYIDDLWDYNKPKETEARFLKLLEASKEMELEYLLEIETQLARTHSLQMNFEKAHEILDSVKERMNAEMIVVRIRYLLERGRTYNSNKDKENSKLIFEKAFDLANKHKKDFYAVDSAHMMGIVEGPPENLQWNEKAKHIAENSDDVKARKWLGSLYNNIGWNYHDIGNHTEALHNFENALTVRESEKDINKILIAKWCIGRCLRSLSKIEEALVIQESIILEQEKRALQPDGFVHEELGELLLLLDKKNESKIHFAKAHRLLSDNIWMKANEEKRLNRLLKLSER